MAAKKASGRKPKGGSPIDDIGRAIIKGFRKIHGPAKANEIMRLIKSGKMTIPTAMQKAAQASEREAARVAKINKSNRAAIANSESVMKSKKNAERLIKGSNRTQARIEVNDALANSEAYRSMRQAGMTKRRAVSPKAQKKGQADVNKISGGLRKNWAKQRETQLKHLQDYRAARKAGDSKAADAAKKKYDKSVEKYGRWEK